MNDAWREFAAEMTSGDVVGVANLIADRRSFVTAEDCARAVIPEVVRLLRDKGCRVTLPRATSA